MVSRAEIDDGAIWRISFGGARGNILDIATLRALSEVFRSAATAPGLRAICLEGKGSDFSYGASIQEHRPAEVDTMLAAIRELACDMLDSHVIIVAVVRGRCLGGGLEVASLCHRIVTSADATFGQPEIALGLFAPIASVVLPGRLRRQDAEDLCLTGRIVPAADALAMGLVDDVVDADPMDAAMSWLLTHVTGRSASSLRVAVEAVRLDLRRRLRDDLPEVERLYRERLMSTHDAVEGIEAFLEKRPPVWRSTQ